MIFIILGSIITLGSVIYSSSVIGSGKYDIVNVKKCKIKKNENFKEKLD